jgi:hypothetical protein
MTLEAVAPGAAGENERGQHGQRCKDPLHVSLPSLLFDVCSSGGLPGDLRGYLGPIPVRDEQLTVIGPNFHFLGFIAK